MFSFRTLTRCFVFGIASREESGLQNARDATVLQPLPSPRTPRAFKCQCGRPVFFRNSTCVVCHTPLGYAAGRGLLIPLEPVLSSPASADTAPAAADDARDEPALWREFGAGADAPRYSRCGNLTSASACNWLVAVDDAFQGPERLCRCCRLTRTLPDQSVASNPLWWNRIELAKRRLVSSLIGLRLPVLSKVAEDPSTGLIFDLLRAPAGGPPVITGHDDGVITIDVEEADDATREQRKNALHEPYRTLLGHLRHETGHYYWQRLVEHSPWLAACREVFGDDRQDYMAALRHHYEAGPPADWGEHHVSAYASSHPWEDWAETWAHYLHMVDTLDTARSFGLDGERVELHYERYTPDSLGTLAATVPAGESGADDFLPLLNGWMELTGVLNELSRSMGVQDFYPFVLAAPAVRKLHLVHRVVTSAAQGLGAVPAVAPPLDEGPSAGAAPATQSMQTGGWIDDGAETATSAAAATPA